MDVRRDIDPRLLAALSKKDVIHPVVLVYLDWPDKPQRYHSNTGTIFWQRENWTGVKDLAAISVPSEGGGLVPAVAELKTGGPSEIELQDMLEAAKAVGRTARIWLGATTEPGGTRLEGEPHLAFAGRLGDNRAEVSDDGSLAHVTYPVLSGPSARARADMTHSDEEQQSRLPGDTGFRRVAYAKRLEANPIQW